MTLPLSHYADRLARYLAKHSERGLRDPYNWSELKTAFTEDEQDHLVEAAYELKHHGLVSISEAINAEDNIYRLRPKYQLYWAFDRQVFQYDPDEDVMHLARMILEDETRSSADKLVNCQNWTLRRFNPAFARIVTLFPEGRIYTAQANEPYPAAGVMVTAEERVKLKALIDKIETSQQVAVGVVREAVPTKAKRSNSGIIKVNLWIVAFEVPASTSIIVGAILIALIVVGLWKWPDLADRIGYGFARSAPTLLEPADAVTLTAYPRHILLKWEPMVGAARYVVEVQAQDPETGEWFPHSYQSRWTTAESSQAIEFIGDQPGRWQVVAIAGDNTRSRLSEWHEFFYESVTADAETEHADEAIASLQPTLDEQTINAVLRDCGGGWSNEAESTFREAIRLYSSELPGDGSASTRTVAAILDELVQDESKAEAYKIYAACFQQTLDTLVE